jgi:hypothetical protein
MRNTSGGKNILLRKTDNNSKPLISLSLQAFNVIDLG